MIGKLLTIAFRNMRRQLRRTVLTALTFAVAVFIYTVLVAVPWSMDRIAYNASKGLRLVVTERNNNSLPARYCGPIRKLPHVLGCAPEILWQAIYRDPKSPIVTYGVTSDITNVTASSDYQVSADLAKKLLTDRRYAMVGYALMNEYDWKLGQPVTLSNPGDSRLTLTFIPLVEFPNEYMSHAFLFDRRMFDDAVNKAYGANIQDRASFLLVRVDRAENMGLVATEIDENFHNSDAETETTTESNSVANVVSAIGNIRTIIYSLCIVVLLTVLLIAGNSMAMMVRDRIGEVAVMRALGFTRSHVGILLFAEAGMIGVGGAAIGAVVAFYYFGHGVRLGEITGMLGYVQVRPETAIAAVVVALIVSIASAIIPVMQAMRVVPAMAFRQVV
ncbi:MAG TPA: ABC transporter permease [Candidatus Binataceae bacterium]|nr:ABC transporter permease [Candidatus Binataceae bacterium]